MPSHTDPSPRLAAKEGRSTLFSALLSIHVSVYLHWCNCFLSREGSEKLKAREVREYYKKIKSKLCFIVPALDRHINTNACKAHMYLKIMTPHTNLSVPLTKLSAGASFVLLK